MTAPLGVIARSALSAVARSAKEESDEAIALSFVFWGIDIVGVLGRKTYCAGD